MAKPNINLEGMFNHTNAELFIDSIGLGFTPTFSEFKKDYEATQKIAFDINGGYIKKPETYLYAWGNPSYTALALILSAKEEMKKTINEIFDKDKDLRDRYSHFNDEDDNYSFDAEFAARSLTLEQRILYAKLLCIMEPLTSVVIPDDMKLTRDEAKLLAQKQLITVERLGSIVKAGNPNLYKIFKKAKNCVIDESVIIKYSHDNTVAQMEKYANDSWFDKYLDESTEEGEYNAKLNDCYIDSLILKETDESYVNIVRDVASACILAVVFNVSIREGEKRLFSAALNNIRYAINQMVERDMHLDILTYDNPYLKELRDGFAGKAIYDIANSELITKFLNNLSWDDELKECFKTLLTNNIFVNTSEQTINLLTLEREIGILVNKFCSKYERNFYESTLLTITDLEAGGGFIQATPLGESCINIVDVLIIIYSLILNTQKRGAKKYNSYKELENDVLTFDIPFYQAAVYMVTQLHITQLIATCSKFALTTQDDATMIAKIESLKDEINALNAIVNESSLVIEEVKEQSEQSIKAIREESEKKNKALEDTINKLNSDKHKLENEVSDLKAQIDALLKEKTDLSNQVNDMLDRLNEDESDDLAEEDNIPVEEKLAYINKFRIALIGNVHKDTATLLDAFKFDVVANERVDFVNNKYDMIFITRYCGHALFYKARSSKIPMGYAFKLNREYAINDIYKQLKKIEKEK